MIGNGPHHVAERGSSDGRLRVVAIDLGGHGESGLGRKDWTIPAFGGDIGAVVKKLGLEHVILVVRRAAH